MDEINIIPFKIVKDIYIYNNIIPKIPLINIFNGHLSNFIIKNNNANPINAYTIISKLII